MSEYFKAFLSGSAAAFDPFGHYSDIKPVKLEDAFKDVGKAIYEAANETKAQAEQYKTKQPKSRN